jgi:hypothetical protein
MGYGRETKRDDVSSGGGLCGDHLKKQTAPLSWQTAEPEKNSKDARVK